MRSFFLTLLAGVLIAFFAIAYVRLALYNHYIFRTGEDLAHYGQSLWHLSHGRLPYSSFKGFVLWGDHGHFIMALLAPLFRLWPDVRLLLILQALAVTLSGLAVFRVAAHRLASRWFGLATLFSYLSFIGIQYALNFDFHPSVLTGVALCWVLYALYFKQPWLYGVALGLGLLTREDAGPIFFLLGVYLLLRRRWRLGLATMAVAATVFLLVVYQIMPIWTPGGVPLLYLDDDNKNFWHLVGNFLKYPQVYLQDMFDTEQKRATINTLFASFGYLPLLSPFTYITTASIFFSRFVNTNDYRWAIDNHSNANILPLLVFGAIFAAHTVTRAFTRLTGRLPVTLPPRLVSLALGSWLVVSALLTGWTSSALPLPHFFSPASWPVTDVPAARAASFATAVATHIAPTDKVSASSGMTGHLSSRWDIYNFPHGLDQADVVIVSLRINTWPLDRDEMVVKIRELKQNPTWELVWDQAEILVFRRKIVTGNQ